MNDDARALKCPGVLFEYEMQILHTVGWASFGVSTFILVLVYLPRSVELPKITRLPKTTENHLENHIYRGIIPS